MAKPDLINDISENKDINTSQSADIATLTQKIDDKTATGNILVTAVVVE